MTGRRVVVTGLGCVTPAGLDAPSTWKAFLAGESAVDTLSERFQEPGAPPRIGAEVRGFRPEAVPAKQDLSRLGRSSQFALAGALEAVRDARLDSAKLDRTRCGAVVGTGIGDAGDHFVQTQNYLKRGARAVHPLYVTRVMPNACSAHVSIEFGFQGPTFTVASACAASGHAIAMAARLIRWGEADLMITGGTEEISCILTLIGFEALRALSSRTREPKKASRPFDVKRDGFVIGEGAGVLVIEELEHALRRGARIYAEIAGIGMSSDADHLTAPEPSGVGAVLAMKGALDDAGRRPRDVQYVNAHGTSTPLNDRIETLALHRVFEDHARSLSVSATKSIIGHLIGGSAAIGVIATLLSIRDGVVHPTINYEYPDPECDLDYVPNTARRLDVRLALTNSFGFGGHCVSIAVARFSGPGNAA